MTEPVRRLNADGCEVEVYRDKDAVGVAAAEYTASVIESVVREKGAARVIFATGASQFEFLRALTRISLPWNRVAAFHLDEYLGLPIGHPASFRKYLNERLFSLVNPAEVHLLDGEAADPEAECARYTRLLLADEIDLACIGIGENGHIAFNDPPVADFHDPLMVKVVELDEACRKQQLGEGWFPTMDDVPTHALTQTVPAILRAERVSCVVPDERKARAVHDALKGPIETLCPASSLRTHARVRIWLDEPAASLL
ncbi:MAG: glucosamine-6-phosphate deaminase [bacterium]|nr:glucosamine-6-phosphate deaminase [bacterium]